MAIIPLYQLGQGRVGQAFIKGMKVRAQSLPQIQFEWLALANSSGPDFQKDDSWKGKPKGILLDLTASSNTTDQLMLARRSGWGLVLANKNPLIQSQKNFSELLDGPIGLRATVGAGLPVIAAIREILKENHTITRMEACLSGTLGILCSELEGGEPFSKIIRNAVLQGFTEPDPRTDLMGGDVAKKILILSRLAGNLMELEDIETESLFPAPMKELEIDVFLNQLEFLDPLMKNRVQNANAKGECLRYVARFEGGKCQVGLQSVPKRSPLGQLRADEKRIVLSHSADPENPIIISGAGSGPDDTAKDLVQDVVEVSGELGVGNRDSGLGIRDSGLGTRDSGFGIRD